MKPAVTLEDAAYKSLANYNRNIWEQGGPWWSFEEAYIDRSSAPEGALPTTFRLIERRLLLEDGPTKIMFTGQTGCGKSMELRRLSEEPEIREKFELVRFSVLDKLNDAVDNDLNHVLLAMASELADHVVREGLHTIGKWDKADEADGELRRWLGLLARGDNKPELPKRFDELTVRLKSLLADWSIRLRSEAELRKKVSGFEARELQALTSMLLVWIADVTERKTLLIVDDADKLYSEVSVDAIFKRGLRMLTDLPTKMVLTFPLNLRFDPGFRRPANVHEEQLFNVKVIRRREPEVVLPGAVAFFKELLDSLVDPAADLIDPAVVEEAVRLSAGVPREFVRLLKLTCEEADLAARKRVTESGFRISVANYLRRELMPRTQLGATPNSLMRVRLSKKVSVASDLPLLHANLVVDYVNNTSWQDVNPVLAKHVDELLDERRTLLSMEGLSGPALDKRLREQLEPRRSEG